jgi:hypothetical protein
MDGASVIAKTGDVQAFTNYCHIMFEKFSSPVDKMTYERVAKGALMLHANSKLIEASREYALIALKGEDENSGLYPWYCMAVGLAEYRSGNLNESEEWCNESLTRTHNTNLHRIGVNNALLSLIYFRTNRQTESEETREMAQKCVDNLQGNDNNFHNKFLMGLLLKEREQLINN